MNIEPLETRAGLARIDERAPEQTLGDGLGIGVGKHDASIVAAQLQCQPLGEGAALAMISWPVAVDP